jgi:transcriptional regulator with XRE-family HTH domain
MAKCQYLTPQKRRLIGNTIRALREKKRKKQYQCAKLAGMNRVAWSMLEHGKRLNSLEKLLAVSVALEVSLSKIFRLAERLEKEMAEKDKKSGKGNGHEHV